MKVYIKTIDTPEHIAMGAEDQPAYVVIKTRIKGEDERAILENERVNLNLGTLQMEIDKRNQERNDYLQQQIAEGEARPLPISEVDTKLSRRSEELTTKAFTFAMETLPAIIANQILEWNWVNGDGSKIEPDDKTIKNKLDQVQRSWLIEQINHIRQYRATDGDKEDFFIL